ncbi:hypothetical protein [Cellulomonas sp. PS-H5]|uniref:hypothetical protein n=1 Tax=Cellulomonas sp. PS-H5 TaxID=2820400 RepID=UPI001C4F9135|nr:hypothetical protein [Cellulomonas sp. PS-H5]MBW0254368.1 hypothetical protein [Cellulomonas sp. PS-H5]
MPALVTRASTPGDLTPPHPADNPYEHTDVVISLRHDFAVALWAGLNDLCETDEYRALVDEDGVFRCAEFYSFTTGGDKLPIGPASFTPLKVVTRDDDYVEVHACYQDSPQRHALRSTGEVETAGPIQRFLITYILSPLTEDEQAALIALGLGLEPTTHRLREVQPRSEPCPDVEVTTQIFVDWPRTSVFTSPAPFSTPPPHWRDDTPPTRPPSLAAR